MKQYILMADVVESGKKDSKQLMKDFKELVDEVNKTFMHGVLSPLTITGCSGGTLFGEIVEV